MNRRNLIAGAVFAGAMLFGRGGKMLASGIDVDKTREEMVEIRKLKPTGPINVVFITREQMVDYLHRNFAANKPEEANLREESWMKPLGILAPDQRIYDVYVNFYTTGAGGYYDYTTDTLYMVKDYIEGDISWEVRAAVAHDTVHALQDQHFDLTKYVSVFPQLNGDQVLARQAVYEGDAKLAESFWLQKQPDLMKEMMNPAASPASLDFYKEVPTYIEQIMGFPYMQGADFAMHLYQNDGGWDGVNKLFANPPASSEQVMHPEKYLSGELPIPVAVVDSTTGLGEGWKVLEVNTLGEWGLHSLLMHHGLNEEEAGPPAAGWGGDQFATFANSESTAMVLATEWDSAEEARGFFDAYANIEAKRMGIDSGTIKQGELRYTTDAQSGMMKLDGARLTYNMASDATTLDALIASQNARGPAVVRPKATFEGVFVPMFPEGTPAATPEG